jgi:cell wall-associated NlpC family hydrolase
VNTCGRLFGRHALRLGAVASAAGFFVVTFATSASADTIADKQARARALAEQIDALSGKVAALSDQYNRAVQGVQVATIRVQQADAAVGAARARADRVRHGMQAQAVDLYMHGGNLAPGANGNHSAGMTDEALRGAYVKTLAGTEWEAIGAYRGAANEERAAVAALGQTQQEQQQSIAQLSAARDATIAAQRQMKAQLDRETREIAALLAETGASRSSTFNPTSMGTSAPAGSGAGAAVAAAKSRQGDPYQWGAAGPDQFDCSGLTMWSWAQGGVSLPHNSGSQYASTQHIPISAVQPGDLVYPSDPDQHVAMYIGDGQIIHAPHSGAVVRIEPLSSWYVLASRP